MPNALLWNCTPWQALADEVIAWLRERGENTYDWD
jgi:hypothetical protein